MAEQMSVMTERVDDIPLLLVHSDKMGVPELLDTYFKPHGNWEGMSLGWTTAVWLAHILFGRGSSDESGASVGSPSGAYPVHLHRAAGQ